MSIISGLKSSIVGTAFSGIRHAFGQGKMSHAVHHFILMKLSSVALLVLIPLFVFTFGPMLGQPHAEVIAYFSQPFPAIVAALTIAVTFKHFNDGVQTLLEDYVHGTARRVSIIVMTCLSYSAMFTGLAALAIIAF